MIHRIGTIMLIRRTIATPQVYSFFAIDSQKAPNCPLPFESS
jgi:hypothetical protein